MPFVELQPAAKGAGGTGVKISRTDRAGIIVSISGAALAALGGGGDATLRVLHDPDPALPRLRIARDPLGRFRLSEPQRTRGLVFLVRIGRLPALAGDPFKGFACTWEAVEGQQAIDIDLPREMRATVKHQPVGQPSTSNGPRPSTVTLPGRVKERA